MTIDCAEDELDGNTAMPDDEVKMGPRIVSTSNCIISIAPSPKLCFLRAHVVSR